MEQMFDIVADIDKYREFVPWCTNSRVTFSKPGMSKADLEIGFPPISERYSSSITLARPQYVNVRLRILDL